jgi:hypothetical protein
MKFEPSAECASIKIVQIRIEGSSTYVMRAKSIWQLLRRKILNLTPELPNGNIHFTPGSYCEHTISLAPIPKTFILSFLKMKKKNLIRVELMKLFYLPCIFKINLFASLFPYARQNEKRGRKCQRKQWLVKIQRLKNWWQLARRKEK